MSQKAIIVAQLCMDDFYQNYADGTGFFLIDDFLIRVGIASSEYYRQEWKREYDLARSEGRNEIVSFDPSTLAEQFIDLKHNSDNGEWVGTITSTILSLPFDQQSSGIQNVFDAKTGDELERSNVSESWQYKYQPYNDRKFYRLDRKEIKVFTRGKCNIQKLRMLYVPSIQVGDENAEIPDGIIDYVRTNVGISMKKMAEGVVIKESLDGNSNKAFVTEANPKSVIR